MPVLQQCLDQSDLPFEISTENLKKKQLRNYTLDEQTNSKDHNFSILVHKIEGRLLLTGPSGLYQDFISKKLKFYRGRMILILLSELEDEIETPFQQNSRESQDKDCNSEMEQSQLYNSQLILSVAESDQSRQILVKALAENGKILQIRGAVTFCQLTTLQKIIADSLHPSEDDSWCQHIGIG